MASILDVAKIAGVSPATVSNVINNRLGVAAATAKRVRAAMEEVGYTPSPLSSRTGPKSGARNGNLKNRNIGICFSSVRGQDINFPLYTKIVCCLERRLRKANLSTVVMNFHDDSSDEDIKLDNVDGVIVFGTSFAKNCGEVIARSGKNAVFILGYLGDSFGFKCDHIIPSNPYIGMLAARYLMNRGHKTIAVINPRRLKHPVMDIREDCFINYLRARDVEAVRIHVDFRDRINNRAATIEEEPNLEKLLQIYAKLPNKPTGIFIPTDSNLVVVQKLFKRAGLKIGKDVEFIGCDNEQETLAGLDPRPATIDVGIDMMCFTAVERLLRSIEKGSQADEGVIISVKAVTIPGEKNDFDSKLNN